MKIRKRDDRVVNFDLTRITIAIEKAMQETIEGVDKKLSKRITDAIKKEIELSDSVLSVEDVQDKVEEKLMSSNRKDVAKKYILYREYRNQNRENRPKYNLLDDDFISEYKRKQTPMLPLGEFVFYRTYSRWLPDEKRREYWWETCRRAVEFNCQLVPNTSKEEAQKFFDNMFNLKQFLSGRTLWSGYTPASMDNVSSQFNCSFVAIDDFSVYKEICYLLMLGVGVGFSVENKHISQLPKIRTDVQVMHKPYAPLEKYKRKEITDYTVAGNVLEINVGDSKLGWSSAIDIFLKAFCDHEFKTIQTVIVNYDSVRPFGETLKTFGGKASGHQALLEIIDKIYKVLAKDKISNRLKKLKSIDAMDIANIIAEGIVVGGVRRSAQMCLFDSSDVDVMQAKTNLYVMDDKGVWSANQDIIHRMMSNNSIAYYSKPSLDELKERFETIKHSAEGNFFNMENALKRNPHVLGTNPCGEILLDSAEFCNLTTVNVMGFVENGILDREGLLEAQKLSAKAGYRMATVEIELPRWNRNLKRDRLLGCSLTGWQDMINATNMSQEDEKTLAQELRKVAREVADLYAEELGENKSLLVTALKPEGCWTSEFTRVTDNGILFIDEINHEIYDKEGFSDVSGFSFDNNKITKTYSNETKDILQITTKNGRTLKITPTHPMSVNQQWVQAQNLRLGDILDYKLGCYTNMVHSELCDISFKPYHAKDYDNKTPTEMSEDLAWLLGAYMANGSFTTKHRIKFHCGHYKVHLRVQKIWEQLFDIKTRIVKCKDRNSYVQDFASQKIRLWMSENKLDKYVDGEMNRIPLPIRKSSYRDILAFIVGYADNDGCFSANSFCIDSTNEKFIRHMQEVAEAVGICFGISVNSSRQSSFSNKPIYKLYMSRAFSNQATIDYINKTSVKAQDRPISKGRITSKNPYTVVSTNILKDQKTYDIEVENTHWYYQGALKSHNTISLLPTVSSGLHFSHSPYYIRRIRINSSDPLVKVCEELKYPVFPEVGQDIETCKTKVIEFPIKAPSGRTKYNVSAIEQLEIYKMFMENYVDHNASNTISVRPNEWEDVIQWVYNNWDSVIGVTFISLDDSFYQLLPYESITEEQYNERISKMSPFIPSLLSKYEKEEVELDIGDSECTGGVCPIR